MRNTEGNRELPTHYEYNVDHRSCATQTLRALPAWNGARTSPDDIRVGEKQKASAQESAAAAAMKLDDLITLSFFTLLVLYCG